MVACRAAGAPLRNRPSGPVAVLFAMTIAVAGCVQQQQVALTTSINSDEMAWARKNGGNTVTGFAVLRTVGGEARTCAGAAAGLAPDSAYGRERLLAIYGNTVKGNRSANNPLPKFTNEDPAYLPLIRQTRCDGQGAFTFEHIPDGVWYVSTSVVWKANPSSSLIEGGVMMQRVELRGNQPVRVSLP
jgi:hypothetical protein